MTKNIIHVGALNKTNNVWLKDTLNCYAIFITLDINCKSINNLVSCFIGCKLHCTCLAYATGIENCYIYTSSIYHSHNTDKCGAYEFHINYCLAALKPLSTYLFTSYHTQIVYILALLRTVATGNWGCGQCGGDPQLKSMLQWAAVSASSRSRMVYFPNQDQRMEQVSYLHGGASSHCAW